MSDIDNLLAGALKNINASGSVIEKKQMEKSSNEADDSKTIFRLRLFAVVTVALAITALVLAILTIEDTKKCESAPNLQCPCFTNPNPNPSTGPAYTTNYIHPESEVGIPLNCTNSYS